MTDADPGWEPIRPFIVCASNGGPFEDRPFVAGVQYGLIEIAVRQIAARRAVTHKEWRRLRRRGVYPIPVVPEFTVYADLLPQLDLLAMEHGMAMVVPMQFDEWAIVTFWPEDTTAKINRWTPP